MNMYYKKGTTISTVNATNSKIAIECPEGYITFDELKYGVKVKEMVVPDIVEFKEVKKRGKK